MTSKQAPRGEGIHHRGSRQQVPAHRVQEDRREVSRAGVLERGWGGAGEVEH